MQIRYRYRYRHRYRGGRCTYRYRRGEMISECCSWRQDTNHPVQVQVKG